MKKREIREQPKFTSELKALVPDSREADELLRDATAFLSHLAETGTQIAGTDIFIKIVSDIQRTRWLVIFYTIDNGIVSLHSISSFR